MSETDILALVAMHEKERLEALPSMKSRDNQKKVIEERKVRPLMGLTLATIAIIGLLTYFALYYSLVALSAVLMGLNVYSFRPGFAESGPASGVAVGSMGSATSVVGSVVSSSYHASLLLPALTFLGVGASSGVGIIEALVEYQLWIITSFILLDLYLVYRLLGKAKAMEIAPR